MNDQPYFRTVCLAAIVWLSMTPGCLNAAELYGNAFVQKDASLKMKGRIIRLFGIDIPTFEKGYPMDLAARALDQEIQGFVRCVLRWRNRDRSSTAVCWYRDVDLGAYLIERGFALATPDAPNEYHALERIARDRRRGIWGFYDEKYY